MSTAQRREREKEERRAQILDAAERLFLEHGYEKTTVDRVAERAEVSKGLVYLYFANKQELFMAMTRRGFELFREQTRQALDTEGAGRHGLYRFRLFAECYTRFSVNHPGYFQAMSQFGSAEIVRSQPGSNEEACTNHLLETLDAMTEVIVGGQEDGSIRGDVPARELAITGWSTIHGLVQMAALRGEAMAERYGISCAVLHEIYFSVMGQGLHPLGAPSEDTSD